MQGTSEVLPQKPVSKPVIGCEDSGVSGAHKLGVESSPAAPAECLLSWTGALAPGWGR